MKDLLVPYVLQYFRNRACYQKRENEYRNHFKGFCPIAKNVYYYIHLTVFPLSGISECSSGGSVDSGLFGECKFLSMIEI